jgi:catechol 2,3-dioxygenase-like lactoylglutathione lyase family enzyme
MIAARPQRCLIIEVRQPELVGLLILAAFVAAAGVRICVSRNGSARTAPAHHRPSAPAGTSKLNSATVAARMLRHMNVLFIASTAVVAADPPQSRKLFMDALGLPLEGEGDGYYSSGSIPGSKHFGVWPLAEAAEACFGTPTWPADRMIPQASIEFEVEDADAVAAAGAELERAGFELLHPARTEPWGQTVTRLLTDDGLIVGISYAPSLHNGEGA